MAFEINPTDGPLPQEAMRRIVEAVDTYRGQSQVFVVFSASPPYEVVSVHLTPPEAAAATAAGSGLSYFGPVAPRPKPSSLIQIKKKVGCLPLALPGTAATVVLLDHSGAEVDRLTVNDGTRAPNPADIEALFLTASGIDKFLIPFLSRMFDPAYAAARRQVWITD